MDTNDLKKLKRGDLLEILVEVSEENDRLRAENAELREQLENKILIMNKAGAISEASLRLNQVFETAQAAADQYLENIQRMESESRIASEWIVQAALADARRIRQAAEDGLKTEPEGVGST